uniref:Nuclear respiratory factor 1 NLS/DNA-binding dimerisation domain-containing protein n=1 Tax=Rhodnius prolixus TaxID=13249 RepID=T1I3T4_RHOPR
MGGVIAQDLFRAKEILAPRPVNEDELEDFLRYLCKYTAGKEQRSRYQKPAWWVDELLPFSLKFVKGHKLLHFNDKFRRMRSLVKAVYHHYSSKDLLKLSSEFSKMHVLSLQFRACNDGSLVVINKFFGNILVRIPASNVEYDYGRPIKGSPIKQDGNIKKEEQNNSFIQMVQSERQGRIGAPASVVDDSSINEQSLKTDSVQNPVDTIELSDSDDDIPVLNSQQSIKSRSSFTSRRSKLSDLTPSPKKKLRLFDKLNSLQKNGCVSIYPLISLTDDDEEDDDAFTLSRSTSLTRSKRDNNNYQDEICQPRLPDSSTLSSQDTFLSNIGLIKKDRLEEITFLQSRQPRRRLRRLRVPLYHMPLELLPALVARGVINPAQLEYNPGANQEKKKRRKKPISQ